MPPSQQTVNPIIGNSNLRQDLLIERQRGSLKTQAQIDAEGISSVANGISGAVDNYYKNTEKNQKIDINKANLAGKEISNESAQIELERKIAVREAQLEIDRLGKVKETANAEIAADLAEVSKEAYQIAKDPNAMNRVELYTNPKYAPFLTANKEFAQKVADNITNNNPQLAGVMQDNFYKKNDDARKRQAAVGSLKVLDKDSRAIDTKLNSSGLLAYGGTEDFKNGRAIIGADGKPDVLMANNTLLSESLGNSGEKEALKLREKAASFARQYSETNARRMRVQGQASGADPQMVEQTISSARQWSDQFSKAQKQAKSSTPSEQIAGQRKVEELLAIKDTPEKLNQPAAQAAPAASAQPSASPVAAPTPAPGGDDAKLSPADYDRLSKTYTPKTLELAVNNPRASEAYLRNKQKIPGLTYANFIAVMLESAKNKGK